LDLARVGVIGHSFGAAAATLTAEQDERVRALVANDLWMLPLPVDLQTHGLQRPGVPALLTQSQAWTKWAEHSDQVVAFTKASRDARLLMYPHTGHSNYSDVPLFSQLVARKLGQIGAADFRQAAATINRAQVAFLKQALATGHGDVDEGRKKIDAPEQMFKEILQAKKAQILARSPPA
jgi:pimeloyl-ACP methyl ester carboxylesterase